MKQASGIKLLLNISLFLLSVIFIALAYKNVLVYSNEARIKVKNEKVQPVYLKIQTKGAAFSVRKPILATIDGTIEQTISEGTFVDKNELIGKIKDKSISVDLLSPEKGILQWKRYEDYGFTFPKSFNENLLDKDKSEIVYPGEDVHKGEIVGTILANDFAYLYLNTKEINISKNAKTIYFIPAKAPMPIKIKVEIVFKGKGYIVCKVNDYLRYVLNENNFLLLTNKINGVIINERDIVRKNGREGIYILNGKMVKFIATKIYKSGKQFIAEMPAGTDSAIVVETPRIVTEGEIINEVNK